MTVVHDFDTAAAFLHTKGKPVPRKKLSNNTYLVRESEDTIHVLLHQTYIVTYRPDSTEINTGGWLTVTTKARINDHIPSPWRVWSTKGVWMLHGEHESYRYTDGITLLRTDTVRYDHKWQYPPAPKTYWEIARTTLLPDEDGAQQDRHNAAMRKLIGTFVKGVTPDVIGDAFGNMAGDCILCRSAEKIAIGDGNRYRIITIGDKMQDTEHLVSHMLESYYVGSLILAALSEKGYMLHPNHGIDTIRRTLRSYLSARLFVGATAPIHGKKPVNA